MNLDVVALADKLKAFKTLEEKRRRTFGLALTSKCRVACKHCINNSRPDNNEELTPTQVLKLCSEIASSDEFDTVNLTGGEPFEVYNLLVEATRIIASYGLRPTVITSAYWAMSEEVARQLVGALSKSGLRALIVSRDEFHEPRVPSYYVVHALRSAIHFDVIPALNLTTGVGLKGYDELLKPIAEILSAEEFKQVHVNESGLLRAGRASRLKAEKFGDETAEKLHAFVCNVNGPILLACGEFAACCGTNLPPNSPMRKGHCDATDARAMVHAFRTDPLVRMVRYLGLRRMAELLGPDGLPAAMKSFIESASPADLCTVCVRLLADPKRVTRLQHLAQEPALTRQMAITAALLHGDDSVLEA
ncbi:MAG: radical SAM protein [Syntrophobacteraceae bacterium]